MARSLIHFGIKLLGKIKDVEPASGDDEVLHRAQAGGGGCVKLMDKQLSRR